MTQRPDTPIGRRIIETAALIMEEEASDLVFQHAVFCQVAIPYKRPNDDVRSYQRRQGRAILDIQAGSLLDPRKREFVPQPLPFGEKARLVLMHLNAEALRQKSPIIEIENSMTAFVRNLLGRPPNARELQAVRLQMNALAGSTIRLGIADGERSLQINTNVVAALDLWYPAEAGQRVLWSSSFKLSRDYFESLSAHAVPLDERAIGALAHSALALDVYAWLSHRLHRIPLQKPQFIPWPRMQEQFGPAYNRIRDFRRAFLLCLRAVLTVYSEAKVDADALGITLRNSRPPVARRSIAGAIIS